MSQQVWMEKIKINKMHSTQPTLYLTRFLEVFKWRFLLASFVLWDTNAVTQSLTKHSADVTGNPGNKKFIELRS